MTKETKESGLAYANEILQDEWAPVLLFGLGFRTFTKQELLELIPALSEEELSAKLCQLQNLRVANPIRDTENKYSLTEDGEQLRRLMMSLSVWGAQQQDDNADRQSVLVVEPESTAKLKDLVKYNQILSKYIK